MEFTMDRQIMQWLGSLGYEVNNKTRESLATIFLQEAHQWEMAPTELEALIRQGNENRRRSEMLGRKPTWQPLAGVA